jgi:hypothetical protein
MTAMSSQEIERRSSYTAGLRALADILDAHPELPLPYSGTAAPIAVFAYDREHVATFARLLPGTVEKVYEDDDLTFGFRLCGQFGGVKFEVIAPRAEVCTRVVTGTREVTREVPDPKALAAVPTTTVTETVEDVEWVCSPLLAPVSA